MAPELLNSNGNSYTNKADLWSIGVVFYQMLYGKTPFDAKNYKDLQKKVKEYSGSNLRFSKDVHISKECKDLLIGLLQYDPKKRIEWKIARPLAVRQFLSQRLHQCQWPSTHIARGDTQVQLNLTHMYQCNTASSMPSITIFMKNNR